MPSKNPAAYATIHTAAQRLDCSTRTIRRLIAAGDLTGYRLGKRLLRVDLNEIDSMLAKVPSARGGNAA